MIKKVFGVFAVGFLISCNSKMSADLGLRDDSVNGVINGVEMSDRATPASRSVVLIETVDASGLSFGVCTATLVSRNMVLTAAHCFDPRVSGVFQRFNIVFTASYQAGGQHLRRPGGHYKKHPLYNSQRSPEDQSRLYDHDIAVATFTGGIPPGFATAALESSARRDYSGLNVYVYGYGRSVDYTGQKGENIRYTWGSLRRGIMTIDSDYLGQEDRYYSSPLSPSHLCQGDSGGPQFYQDNKGVRIVGVNSASFGSRLPNGMTRCTSRSQMTKVAPFYTWILDNMRRM